MPRTPEQLEYIRKQTKNKIIESAVKMFSLKGYHGTSINDIALDAGISKGLAYNYFESKQHLLEAIFESMMSTAHLIVKEIEKYDDPYEQLHNLINSSFDYAVNNRELWILYMRMAFQPEIFTTTINLTAEFTMKVFRIIENIFRRLGFEDPASEARIISATIDGIMLYYLIDSDNFPLEQTKNNLLRKYSKDKLSKLI